MKKQWKLDNKGMTLLEVIVAFAIFAIAATILITGFNGALKVMGNSEAIKDASQKNASGLEIEGSPLDKIEGVAVEILGSDPKQIEFGKNKEYKISGVFQTATSKKQNDQTEMSLKMFEPDTKVLVTPMVPTPPKDEDREIKIPSNDRAYYDIGGILDVGSFITEAKGAFAQEIFNEYKNKNFIFKNGVVTKTQLFDSPSHQPATPYIENLYFSNSEPFRFGLSGMVSYSVKFLYIGNSDQESSFTFNINYKWDESEIIKNGTNTFVLNSYDEKKDTILYLPQKLTIKIKKHVDSSDKGIVKSVILFPGYYSIPNGFDLLEIGYSEEKYNEFLNYKKDYSIDDLKKLGIDILS